MKIILADHFGICFGVRDAIAQAERLADAGPVTILGELVHNPVVRERLRARGVNEHPLEQTTTTTEVSPAVMVTAHGASDFRRAAWKGAGYTIADGTCPLVRHAHTQLHELVRAGFFPVVIGRPGHVEVRGLTEDFPGATVIEKREDIQTLPSAARLGVISQTTQRIDHVHRLVAEIRRAHPKSEVRFVDTVCKPTKDRQRALGRLIAEAEVIVVVGGLTSNNTLQLAASCRAAGRRAIHIERPEDLRPADFLGVNVVGLTAGTSTLPETVEAVHMRLRTFAA
jgi:4-hydroxy-3-methylbut-2-enyl diphosphate reductase